MKLLTTSEFIHRAKEINRSLYDYSQVIYCGTHKKVKIICQNHGTFLQTPHAHIGKQQQKCPKCYGRDKSTNEFIVSALSIHGTKYNYSLVKYERCNRGVYIICPQHGKFDQLPLNHLKGKGCPKCAHIISKPESEFLNYYNILIRNYRLPNWKTKPVDGICGNDVYEFLGDYWHGNLEIYSEKTYHPKRKITYGELNTETIKILQKIKSLGYKVNYIWETDWNNFKSGKTKIPKLQSL